MLRTFSPQFDFTDHNFEVWFNPRYPRYLAALEKLIVGKEVIKEIEEFVSKVDTYLARSSGYESTHPGTVEKNKVLKNYLADIKLNASVVSVNDSKGQCFSLSTFNFFTRLKSDRESPQNKGKTAYPETEDLLRHLFLFLDNNRLLTRMTLINKQWCSIACTTLLHPTFYYVSSCDTILNLNYSNRSVSLEELRELSEKKEGLQSLERKP